MGNSESKVPLWEKYILTIQEAAEHFHIGEKKLRKLVEERTDADYIKLRKNQWNLGPRHGKGYGSIQTRQA